MEPLARLDSNSILAEDIFLEIFDQEDEIMKARMILSLTDRAGKAAGAQEANSNVGQVDEL